jgi:hypothetical protein
MSLVGCLISLGGMLFGALIVAGWHWIAEEEGANTPEGKEKAYWCELAKQYTAGMDLKGLDAAHYHVMVSLLKERKATEYYWECWRNGIPVPPPPPFDMVFSRRPASQPEMNEQTQTNLNV